MREKVKIEIRAEVRDKNGRLIKPYPWKRANTLLRQFIQMLALQMGQLAVSIYDTTPTLRSVTVNSINLAINAGANVTTFGILIGTGTTAVTMSDTKIETQVVTNVLHSTTSVSVENPDTSTWRTVIARTFTNNTGSLLSITEVGMICYGTASLWLFLIDRTLYSVSVPSGSAVTLTYRITVSL